MKTLLTGIMLLGSLLCTGTKAWSEQNGDPENLDLSLENLFSQIPMVVTASRREQKANETPASVYVITAEQIRQSGATNIPDLFRTVPGMSVFTTSLHDVGVHIRGAVGFNGRFSDKVLVMINGRSVYWDVYGTVFWDLFPISLEEIKQIEIIKSPASSLYGTNAFSGVINFITKSPDEDQGISAKVTAGERNALIGYAGYAQRIGPWSVKASAEHEQSDEWDWETWPEPSTILRANATMEYHFSDSGKVSLSGGYSATNRRRMFMDEMAGTALMVGGFRFGRAQYERSDWTVCMFARGEDFDIDVPRQNQKTTLRTRTYDGDLQKTLRYQDIGSLTLGTTIRRTEVIENLYIPEGHAQTQYAALADGEYKPMSWLMLATGGRYDWHPLTKSHFSPRASVSLKPHADHVVRFAWGNAFRNPTLVNSYLNLRLDMAYSIPAVDSVPLLVEVLGSEGLSPEEISSYEVSYLAKPFKRLTSSLDFYYREFTGIYRVQESTSEFYSANEIYPGSPASFFPKHYLRKFENGKGVSSGWGVEIQEDVLLTNWLWLVGSYWYQSMNETQDRHITLTGKTLMPGKNNPSHHASGGFRVSQKGFTCELTGLYVDSAQFFITDSKEGNLTIAEPYYLLNGSVGYSYENLEIRIGGFNLLDRIYYEYPRGDDLPNMDIPEPSSDPLGRKLAVTLRYRI